MLKQRYVNCDPSKTEAAFILASDRIHNAVVGGNWRLARDLAEDWGAFISDRLRLSRAPVWKDFKRKLAARWFGQPEKRTFRGGWSVDDVLSYALQFQGKHVRASSFPESIACHAKSIRLVADEHARWREQLCSLAADTLVEVFPEASTTTSICFRRFCYALGEEVLYEAGHGQATNVFEEQQGQHPVVFASKGSEDDFAWTRTQPRHCETTSIQTKLKLLIQKHERVLQLKCFDLCHKTGIEAIGLEGYFDPASAEDIVIVDIDLPFDFVFMA